MPGQPKYRALCAAAGADQEAIMDRVADGETLREIGVDYGVSRSMMYRWVAADPERKAQYQEAKRASAEVLVEEAVEILDEAPAERDAIAKAKARASVRTWLAERLDRAQYGGEEKTVTVHVNIGQLHLDALRSQPVRPVALMDGEAEVLEGDAEVRVLPSGHEKQAR